MSTELEPVDIITDLVNSIQEETDPNKAQDLIALFNWNISKKNIARIHKLNNLYDSVTDQMALRFETKPDQFSNDDLINYMKTVQGAIDSSSKNLSAIEEPPPQIIHNNTQINVNVMDNFDREARARILAAVQATLAAAQENPELIDYEDKTEGDTSNE